MNLMKEKKLLKLFAFLLAICMGIGFLPLAASAEEIPEEEPAQETEEIEPAEAEEEITPEAEGLEPEEEEEISPEPEEIEPEEEEVSEETEEAEPSEEEDPEETEEGNSTYLILDMDEDHEGFRESLIAFVNDGDTPVVIDDLVFSNAESLEKTGDAFERDPVGITVSYEAERKLNQNRLEKDVRELVSQVVGESGMADGEYYGTVACHGFDWYTQLKPTPRGTVEDEISNYAPLEDVNKFYILWDKMPAETAKVFILYKPVCGDFADENSAYDLRPMGAIDGPVNVAGRLGSTGLEEAAGWITERSPDLPLYYGLFEGGKTYTAGIVLETEIGFYFTPDTEVIIPDEEAETEVLDVHHAAVYADIEIDHDWDNGVIVKQVSETEDGLIEYTCQSCGETKTEVIPASDFYFTENPANTSVLYTEEASFSVAVNRPEFVESYQWYLTDGVSGAKFKLTGTTAKTDTLFIPGFQRNRFVYHELVECVVTTLDGRTFTSRPAQITIDSRPEVWTPIVYVGDLLVKPGEELDLSTTTFGSGIVRFDENGHDVYFENMHFDNSECLSGYLVDGAGGIEIDPARSRGDVHIHLAGENEITTVLDPAGVPIVWDFTDEGSGGLDSLIIEGDGRLRMVGGEYYLHMPHHNLEINAPLDLECYEGRPTRGIYCNNLTLGENAHITGNLNGEVFRTSEEMVMEPGSSIDVNVNPGFMEIHSYHHILDMGTSFRADQASVRIKANVTPDNYDENGGLTEYVGIAADEGSVTLTASTVSIDMECEKMFNPAMHFHGIWSTDSCEIKDGSEVRVSIEGETVDSSTGIHAGSLKLDGESQYSASLNTGGAVKGIEAGSLEIGKANVSVSAVSANGEPEFGIEAKKTVIDLGDDSHRISLNTRNGIAIAAQTGDLDEVPADYAVGYGKPKALLLADTTRVTSPQDTQINLSGYYLDNGSAARVETVYDSGYTVIPVTSLMMSGTGAIGG